LFPQGSLILSGVVINQQAHDMATIGVRVEIAEFLRGALDEANLPGGIRLCRKIQKNSTKHYWIFDISEPPAAIFLKII
jgi:hypothetical protein